MNENMAWHTTRHVCYTIPRCLAWAPHTQTQRCGVLAMTIRPYKPRDSTRSVLLTVVHDRLTGLAVHPRGGTCTRPCGINNHRCWFDTIELVITFARARCRWSRSLAVPATGLRARWPRPGVRGLNCGHCATTTARRERKFHLLLAVQMWRNEVCQSTCCNDACG